MATEVYGHSDDVIEIDGDVCDELYVNDRPVSLMFSDGTILSIRYGPQGVWKIEASNRGELFDRIDECNDPDAERYSDTAHFRDGLQWYKQDVGGDDDGEQE